VFPITLLLLLTKYFNVQGFQRI